MQAEKKQKLNEDEETKMSKLDSAPRYVSVRAYLYFNSK
jgi:hypothetical protein